MWISERLKHLRAISGLWWLVINAAWGLVCAADVLVGHYGTDSVKFGWNTAWYFPKLGWQVWIIGFLAITLIFVVEGSYRNAAAREKLASSVVLPEVFLEYREVADVFDCSGLFVRVQNDRNAFAVKLSSPIVVGGKSKRMALRWDVPLGMIGQEAVTIAVRCMVYRENDEEMADPIGGFSSEQIGEFLRRKADKPDEVIVSVDCLDVEGRHCPTKQFRLFLHRNETDASWSVRCEPMPLPKPRK